MKICNNLHDLRSLSLPEQSSTVPGEMLYRGDRSSARRSLGWNKAQQPRTLEQGSTVPAGAELDGPWSKAQQGSSEQCSMITWLVQGSINQEHWSKARPCPPEQGSMVPGARLNRDDRSNARRSLGWSKAQQLRTLILLSVLSQSRAGHPLVLSRQKTGPQGGVITVIAGYQ